MDATSKRAHLSSKEFSTLHIIAGCSGSEIQHDQEIRDSNDQYFRDLQCKNNAKTAKSGKIDRSILFSPSASSVSCESSTMIVRTVTIVSLMSALLTLRRRNSMLRRRNI